MDKVMDQLESLEARYEEVQEMMADPEVISDTKRYMEITKEEADMREVIQKYRKYKADQEEIAGNKEIIADGSDAELVEMAKMENAELEAEVVKLEDEIKIENLITKVLHEQNIEVSRKNRGRMMKALIPALRAEYTDMDIAMPIIESMIFQAEATI